MGVYYVTDPRMALFGRRLTHDRSQETIKASVVKGWYYDLYLCRTAQGEAYWIRRENLRPDFAESEASPTPEDTS